ncbi:DUF5041 domain-containing protein [Bacteroidales bacterium OttesenSCG-928-L03]|nr:DUF5041 domain-containing protein [Bacteroidales bacterium OttesenSCG-928-L03]
MKKLFLAFITALISISALSQETYRQDDRPQEVKEDQYDLYQTGLVSELDLLHALELLGVQIFIVPISPAFEKEYKMTIVCREYVDSVEVKSRNINLNYARNNTYPYYVDTVRHFDYIPRLAFYTQEKDSTLFARIETFGSTTGCTLKKNIVREGQFYRWRRYSQTDWKLNEEVPLLVYASSWYDERFKINRFCGVVDLSLDEEQTKELLDNSPHYYMISLKVYE